MMLSWYLWRTIAEPATRNPIFRRVRDDEILRTRAKEPIKVPRFLMGIVFVLFLLAVIRAPHFFVMMMQIPALMIAFIVMIPLIVPIFVILAGTYMVSAITSNINKEKRQYTYELLCASPHGSLSAIWMLATGILHRGNWFNWIKAVARFTYRSGQITLVIVGIITLMSMFSLDEATRLESIRTLVNLALLVILYYTSMIQPIVLSFIVGLYATSLNLNQRDASMIGILMYLLFQLIPYIAMLALFVLLNTTFNHTHAIVQILIDVVILCSLYVIREASIMMLWRQLARQLNATSDLTSLSPRIAPVTI